jgi:transcriptional regulator with XRE-family HTH domain
MLPFAIAVTEARRLKGLTEAELAHLIGVDRKTVIRWEAGTVQMPQGSTLRRLLYTLEINVMSAARPAVKAEVEDMWSKMSDDERELLETRQRDLVIRARLRAAGRYGLPDRATEEPSEPPGVASPSDMEIADQVARRPSGSGRRSRAARRLPEPPPSPSAGEGGQL